MEPKATAAANEGTPQHQLIQDRLDFLLPSISQFVRDKKWLNVHPEYQRRLVWDQKKKSRFIESLFMNIPIPPVFLFETDLNRYEVMDGQQRLNAILEFYDDAYALKGLEECTDLNGQEYSDLPDRTQRNLDRRKISAIVLSTETRSASQEQDVRRQVFERLNTGGLQLNAQEIRNCLYSRSFNDLLIELACLPDFTKSWGIPPHRFDPLDTTPPSSGLAENKLYQRMTDCEIVLRFFAFRREEKAIKGSVRSILDECMEEHERISDATKVEYRRIFRKRMRLAVDIFGDAVFGILERDSESRDLSVPLYDAVMVAIDRLWDKREFLRRNASRIREDVDDCLSEEENRDLIVGKPNTAMAIKKRLKLLESTLKKHAK